MDATALSITAREMRKQLARDLGIAETNILITHPQAGAQQANQGEGKQYLNLFFHRVEYDGYPSDGTVADPFYIRFHCLITAYGNDENIENGQKILAGENDLRLIGGVMNSLHGNPVFFIKNDDDDLVAQIAAVMSNLTLDDINKIWSTQGDTPFRPSVAYELSLLPIPVAAAVDKSPRVARMGVNVQETKDQAALPDSGLGLKSIPTPVPKISVDPGMFNWSPHICFRAGRNIRYERTLSGLSPGAEVRMIGLGKPNEIVDLHWEVWDSLNGWQPVTAPPEDRLRLSTWSLDPTQQDMPASRRIELPSVAEGQISVYATRTIDRPGTDPLIVRSNPLLIIIR